MNPLRPRKETDAPNLPCCGAVAAVPPAFPVELLRHDPAWADNAQREAGRVAAAIREMIVSVHHIGSTAIPGIRAKPILDLMPVVHKISDLDDARQAIEMLGYAWWGDYGLPGRRYCTLDDPVTKRRNVQLHFFENGSPEIARLLAFRDYLRSRPGLAREYEAEKCRCQALHRRDSHAYNVCKDAWIRRIEAEALPALIQVNKP
ncbi:MAG: GrpB family protein [Beijerinckiaceae bacterium]|nr:GrpB family protein [Beijerinckiaceae bacterium]MCI0736515.1 GrpB family protein [Beijerinckiaceae bacterium]